ncbi:MAG: molecular chaperone [Gammaproteobacteria bacterium]|nr:molecular chaperone [Gammaproteobacteria bacterium]
MSILLSGAVLRRGLALTLLAAASTAAAGSFSISPIRVELSGRARTQVLTVRNEEDRPVVVQLRTLAWSQPEGRDRLEATRDLLATPPLFTLPARGQQVVRIATRRGADTGRELTYRLLIEEVPRAMAADFTGLQVALRLSLPVFVQAEPAVRSALHWSAAWLADGRLQLRARNDGGAHVQVLDFDVHPAGADTPPLHSSAARYLLPGSQAEWTLELPQTAARFATLHLQGASDQGDFTAEVSVLSP